MLTLAFAQYSMRWHSSGPASPAHRRPGHSARPRPRSASPCSQQGRFYYLVLAACSALPVLPFAGALAIRRRVAGIQKRRRPFPRLQHPPLQDRRGGDPFTLGGLAAARCAPFAGFANTELLFWLFSGRVLIMVIVGGSGTLIGPIIGAAFFMLVSNLTGLDRFLGAGVRTDLHLFVLFAPQGIWGLARWRSSNSTA